MDSGTIFGEKLTGLGISYVLSKPVLFFVTLGFTLIYIGVSLVLFYHWANYGMRSRGIIIAKNIYTATSLFLFICLFTALYLY